MLDRLAELNRVLLALLSIMDEAGTAPRESVIRECQARTIDGRLPDHDATISFAAKMTCAELEMGSNSAMP